MQLLTVISTIDDLNYPEKTDTYYIVNVPYVFSACWKVCGYINSYWRNVLNIPEYTRKKKEKRKKYWDCGSSLREYAHDLLCPC